MAFLMSFMGVCLVWIGLTQLPTTPGQPALRDVHGHYVKSMISVRGNGFRPRGPGSRMVEGIVRESNGRPVPNVTIVFRHRDRDANSENLYADTNGHFQGEILPGVFEIVLLGETIGVVDEGFNEPIVIFDARQEMIIEITRKP